MKKYVITILFSAIYGSVFSQQQTSYRILPAASVNLGYPQVTSIALGLMFPFKKQTADAMYPKGMAFRADLDLGLTGSMLSAGLFVPYRSVALNLKTSAIRTWVWGWDYSDLNIDFYGSVVDVLILGRAPLKISMGYFIPIVKTELVNENYLITIGVGF